MKLEYRKIFKQAWQITKLHKFLWLFGLFLFWGNAVSFTYSMDNGKDNTPNAIYSQPWVIWLQTHPQTAFWVLLGVVLLFVILVYLYFRCKIALLIAVKALIDKQSTSIAKAMSASQSFFGRVVGVAVVTNLIILILGVIISAPVIYLNSVGLDWRAKVLLILGLCILIPAAVVTSLINVLAPMFVVFYDQKIGESIRASFNLISKYWVTMLVFSIFTVVLVAMLFALIAIVVAPFVLLGIFAYHKMDPTMGLILTTTTISLGLIVFLILQSAAAVFQQAAWILAFFELIKPEKLPEQETLSATEVVS